MPKHRKRRIMLSIVSIVLFVVLSAQLSTVSFSVPSGICSTPSLSSRYPAISYAQLGTRS